MQKEKIESKKSTVLKSILLHVGLFVVILGVLWFGLCLSTKVPNEKIKTRMTNSAISYLKKDSFDWDKTEKLQNITDNYADVILLKVCWQMGYGSTLKASLDTKYNDGTVNKKEYGESYDEFCEWCRNCGLEVEDGEDYGENFGFFITMLKDVKPNTDYTRYWHGSALFIRPLLLITGPQGIKMIMFVFILVLLAISVVMLICKKQYFAAFALVAGMMAVQIWNIRLALEYIPGFLALALILPFFIMFEKKGDRALTLLSLASGVIIAFFDFLTIETITITVPLLIVFIMRKKENRMGEFKPNLILTVKCLVIWGLSYAATFISKWSLASIVTGENKFKAALSEAGYRSIGGAEELPIYKQIVYAPLANISTLFGGTERVSAACILVGLLVTGLVMLAVLYLFHGKVFQKDITVLSIVFIVLVYVRYLVLSNHSYLHEFFTYRAQMVVVMALLTICWFNIDLSVFDGKGNRKRRENGSRAASGNAKSAKVSARSRGKK